MSQPAEYDTSHAFISDQANASWFPGSALDTEFNNIATVTDQIRANLALIQRDDGALANSSVTFNTLSPTLQSAGLSPLGPWASGVQYNAPRCVVQGSSLYQCAVSHTSSSFAADLGAGFWTLIANLSLLSGTTTVAANLVAAGPSSGAAAAPVFRSLVNADLPITLTPTVAGLTINPIAATLNQGLVVTQTGPASGSAAGPVQFNLINSTFQSGNVTAGSTFGLNNTNNIALRANLTVGTANLSGQSIAGVFQLRHTAASSGGDKIGLTGAVYSNANDTTGGLFGGVSYNYIDTAGVAQLQVGHEIDVGTLTGGTTNNRFGLSVVTNAPVQGSVRDSAIVVGGINAGNGAPGGFLSLLLLSNYYGQPGLATTANIFSTDTAYTVNDVFHYGNMTVNGNILGFPNVALTGSGRMALGANVVPAAPVLLQATISSGGQANLQATTNTTVGASALDLLASSNANELYVAAFEAANTSTSFGITRGNYTGIFGAGASNSGLLLGTTVNTPVVVGTNNLERYRVSAAGGFSVGTTTDPGIGAILANTSIKSQSPTAGIGYATGAGGAVTQITSKATATPAINTMSGAVTMNNAALAAATIVSFVLTNSSIAATDVLILNHISGGTPGSYTLNARAAAGSATIDVRNNTAGSLSEAIVIQFAVIKGVNA